MSETFVDLTYRGLPLGRRIKLTRVRATNGYLEHPTPMPVGTSVAIVTDDGLTFDAVVEAIHEQVGGSDRAPGMRVKPVFATDQLSSWWTSRAEPDDAPAPVPERAKSITVRPRSATIPEPMPVAAAPEAMPVPTQPTTIPGTISAPRGATGDTPVAPPGEAPKGGKSTTVMAAVDQELLSQLTRDSGEIENLTRRTGEHEVVDDGMRTTVMDAVDPAALGLDISMLSSESGPMQAADEEDSGVVESGPTDTTKPKTKKPRKKKR